MAYTIISQNNSTTTLSDGVNTITVPSRVNLTSGNFTIVEVNNNMATLEDGDGNVYRDIPCVATLAGEGGGGGSALPDQTGHSGEFLTTDGTDASWSAKPIVNNATGTNAIGIGAIHTVNGSGSIGIGGNAHSQNTYSIAIGQNSSANAQQSIAVGTVSNALANNSIAIGRNALVNFSCVSGLAIGCDAGVGATNAIQISSRTYGGGPNVINNDANTFKVANANGNFEMMSADGTIPTARFTTDPVSDGTYYPTLTISSGTPTRSWSTIAALQNTATGTDSLTILGTATAYSRNVNIGIGSVAGSSSVAIGHNAKVGDHTYYNSVSIGYNTLTGNGAIAIGGNARAQETSAIAIGSGANTSYYTGVIQLGYGTSTASDTFQVWSYRLLNKSDGTIPTARLTKVNSTITLTAAGWSGGSQTVTVTGMTATGVVLVSPDPTDQSAYTSAGILCTAQAADSLTFTATTTPSADIDVVVVML